MNNSLCPGTCTLCRCSYSIDCNGEAKRITTHIILQVRTKLHDAHRQHGEARNGIKEVEKEKRIIAVQSEATDARLLELNRELERLKLKVPSLVAERYGSALR